jgi:hypothetical protein
MDGIGRGLIFPSSRETNANFKLGTNKENIRGLILAFSFPKTQYGMKTNENTWTRQEAIEAMEKEQKVNARTKLIFMGKQGPEDRQSFWEFRQRPKYKSMKDKSIEILKRWETKVDHGGKWFWARWLLYRVEGKQKSYSKKSRKPKKPKSKSRKS